MPICNSMLCHIPDAPQHSGISSVSHVGASIRLAVSIGPLFFTEYAVMGCQLTVTETDCH
jgi:hypothetical protein